MTIRGHEALVKGHPVCGLGGCAVMTADLDRAIRRPWHEGRDGLAPDFSAVFYSVDRRLVSYMEVGTVVPAGGRCALLRSGVAGDNRKPGGAPFG